MSGATRVGAAVDVGSNSIHLLVAAIGRTRLRPLLDESLQLGLGAVVDREGQLTPEAREAAAGVLRGYVARARALGAERVTLLGTEPLRRAADRTSFQAQVRRATGVALHVLSPEREAELTLLGVTGGKAPAAPLLVLDIGGGSTELIVASPDGDPVVGTLQTGSARLAARFVDTDPPTWPAIGGLRVEAVRLMAVMPTAQPARAVVAGGTGTNTNRLLGRIRLATLDAAWLERAMVALATHPAATLAAERGLSEQRVRQLPAGVALLEAAMSRYGLRRLATSDASLREGAIVAAALAGDAWPERLASMVGPGRGDGGTRGAGRGGHVGSGNPG